jgi:hypothetical protein
MTFVINQIWTTAAKLSAVVLRVNTDSISRPGGHRCGYVGVPESHPCYGKSYFEQLDIISKEQVKNTTLGNKSPILLLTASVNSNGDDEIRRSLDILIDVHGGLTYSSKKENSDYPVKSTEKIWWFGFDCAHHRDDEDGGRSLQYCIAECESLATQLAALSI